MDDKPIESKTQMQKLAKVNNKLLEDMIQDIESGKFSKELKKNQVALLQALNQNIVKVQTYLDGSQDTKDASLQAQMSAIRIRREEVLRDRKKKSQK